MPSALAGGTPTSLASGWWVDKSLRTLAIDAGLLKVGANEIVMVCDYAEDHPGLEMAYLLGDFSVKLTGPRAILSAAAPRTLKTGDWVKQGMPFYSGNVDYNATISPKLAAGERLIVRVDDYRGAAVRVTVDGRDAGLIAWQPNEVDITSLVKSGRDAQLRIEVLGHRRNSHGPLHLTEKWPTWTGPWQFIDDGHWQDDYQLVPAGLMKSPQLVVRSQR